MSKNSVTSGVNPRRHASDMPVAADAEDVFQMTNLSPRMTGLPTSIRVSPRGNARRDVRIKVNKTHGRQMTIDNTAVMALRPTPRLIAGHLTPDDQRALTDWIKLNLEAVVAYWTKRSIRANSSGCSGFFRNDNSQKVG